MGKKSYNFSGVSAERVFAEFSKAAKGKYFGQVYTKFYDVFSQFIPYAAKTESVYMNAEDAVASLKALKADNKSIRLAEIYFNAPQENAVKLLRKYGYDGARFLCEKRGMLNELEIVIQSKVPYTVSMLAVNGNDIFPLSDDKTKIGKTLDTLLDMVIDGKAENKREILLQKAVDIL